MAQQPRTQHPATPMEREAEGFTGGPGIVATKSQARGSLAGIVIGAIVLGVAGMVAGGVSGGIVNPERKLDRGEADV